MHRRFIPSPSMAVALIALFVAMGGVGYAAATIGSAQIKNNSIRSKDIRSSNVGSSDIKNGAIVSKDINKKTRAALQGKPVAPAAGSVTNNLLANGAVSASKLGATITRTAESTPTTDADGTQNGPAGPVNTATATASCAAGETLLTGGARWVGGNEDNNENVYINESYPNGNSWQAEGVVDFGAQGQGRLQAIAVCLR